MSLAPILLIGGSGVVGRWAARFLRDAHPGTPLLIGGRNLAKAEEAAAEIGGAEGVALDLAADDLGLGERSVSVVAVFFTTKGSPGSVLPSHGVCRTSAFLQASTRSAPR
jgi:uncharacterized protein YbjT (DUF2867 family)